MRSVVSAAIVVVIIVFTAAMAASACLNVQEAARRMTCSNYLRSISIGVHNYHDTFMHFPSAAYPHPDPPPERPLSWLVAVGPYLESNNLYSRLDLKKGWDADENRYLALTDYGLFHCPSFPDVTPTTTLSVSHYVGVAGLGADALSLPAEDSRVGIFGYERKLKLNDLNGLGERLIMITETVRVMGPWTAAGAPTSRGLDESSPAIGRDAQFGGLHFSGFLAGMADASVRTIRADIDPQILAAIVTVQGCKTVPEF